MKWNFCALKQPQDWRTSFRRPCRGGTPSEIHTRLWIQSHQLPRSSVLLELATHLNSITLYQQHSTVVVERARSEMSLGISGIRTQTFPGMIRKHSYWVGTHLWGNRQKKRSRGYQKKTLLSSYPASRKKHASWRNEPYSGNCFCLGQRA